MYRDINKITANTEVNSRYDLRSNELKELYSLIQEGKAYDALTKAFVYGYAMGERAEKAAQNRTK